MKITSQITTSSGVTLCRVDLSGWPPGADGSPTPPITNLITDLRVTLPSGLVWNNDMA